MLTELKNKKIALLGLGLENQALLVWLKKKFKNIDISICDFRPKKELKKKLSSIKDWTKIKWQNGESFNVNLDQYDILFRSPGWPRACPGIQAALKTGTKVSSPMNIFFEFCPSPNIIGVSGSKGKGTTASLITKIIQDSGKKVFLGGNIGLAPLSFINKIKKDDWVVLELSSFQLEDLNYSPKIAVLTNLFKEHLSPADPHNPNFHTSMSNYKKAKIRIAQFQKKSDYLLLNQNLKKSFNLKNIKSQIIFFSPSKTPSSLVGKFNQENIGAAETVAKILKIKKTTSKKTIANFSNLEHRLELVRELPGLQFYNNSFSTTPESTQADLESFSNNIILLAGGADKGANFNNLAKSIKKRVKFLILFPGLGSQRIKEALIKIHYPLNKMIEVKNMSEAVSIAFKKSQTGDIILLSTACASFGLFKNYHERGNLFQTEVKKIKL